MVLTECFSQFRAWADLRDWRVSRLSGEAEDRFSGWSRAPQQVSLKPPPGMACPHHFPLTKPVSHRQGAPGGRSGNHTILNTKKYRWRLTNDIPQRMNQFPANPWVLVWRKSFTE